MRGSSPRWARVGLLAALVGLCAACQTPPKVAKREPVAPVVVQEGPKLDPALGLLVRVGELKLQLPKDWQPDPSRPDAWEEPQTSAGIKHGASFHALLGAPKPASASWEDHWAGLREAYKDRASPVQRLVAEGPLALEGGGSGWFFVVERAEEGASFRLYQAMIGGARHTTFLTWGTRVEGWEKWGELFERCARSVRVSP